jgi:hypothetical protein
MDFENTKKNEEIIIKVKKTWEGFGGSKISNTDFVA